jgi:hypothetical protein
VKNIYKGEEERDREREKERERERKKEREIVEKNSRKLVLGVEKTFTVDTCYVTNPLRARFN